MADLLGSVRRIERLLHIKTDTYPQPRIDGASNPSEKARSLASPPLAELVPRVRPSHVVGVWRALFPCPTTTLPSLSA